MIKGNYTFPPIQGRDMGRRLPAGWGLVLEGGGTRSFYSAGVFDAFMEGDLMFPYIAGVSAGAANVISYISGQLGRTRQVVAHYVGDKRYVSKRNLLKLGTLFGNDFIFHTIPQRHVAMDWAVFHRQKLHFYTGAFDCIAGVTRWFGKEHVDPELRATIASCALPLVSPIAVYQGMQLLDGGLADPIPIEKSLSDGNRFHVVVLTRNRGYRKAPFAPLFLAKGRYRAYPRLVETLRLRHEIYHRQLAICEQLERAGKAILIRPRETLRVHRTGSDVPKLLQLYDEGVAEGREALPQILSKAGISPEVKSR